MNSFEKSGRGFENLGMAGMQAAGDKWQWQEMRAGKGTGTGWALLCLVPREPYFILNHKEPHRGFPHRDLTF